MTKTICTAPATRKIAPTAEDLAIRARLSVGHRHLYSKCDALDAHHMALRTRHTAKCGK